MSIFDGMFKEDGWVCTWATKNILKAKGWGYNHVNVNLIYERDGETVEVGASYSVNIGGKISVEQPIKMFVKTITSVLEDGEMVPKFLDKRSLRAFREDEMTEVMITDLNAVNKMFDIADAVVKRVYL